MWEKPCKHLEFWFLIYREILIWFLILVTSLFPKASFYVNRLFFLKNFQHFSLFTFLFAHAHSILGEKPEWPIPGVYMHPLVLKICLPFPFYSLHFFKGLFLEAQVTSLWSSKAFAISSLPLAHLSSIIAQKVAFLLFLSFLTVHLPPTHSLWISLKLIS